MKNKIYITSMIVTFLAPFSANAGEILDHPATKGAMVGAVVGCPAAAVYMSQGGSTFHLDAKSYAGACLAGAVAGGAVGALYGEGYAILTNHDAPSEQELAQDSEE